MSGSGGVAHTSSETLAGWHMRNPNTLVALALSGVLLAATASSADAGYRHGYYGGHYGGRYYGHGGPGLVGGVVIGALTLATLPFAILGAATSPAPPPPPPPYYGPRPYEYGPPAYGPPSPPPGYYRDYGRNYGPPPGYYGN